MRIKEISFCGLVAILVSCAKSPQWKEGELTEMSAWTFSSPHPVEEFFLKDERIRFFEQVHMGIPIEGSFIKGRESVSSRMTSSYRYRWVRSEDLPADAVMTRFYLQHERAFAKVQRTPFFRIYCQRQNTKPSKVILWYRDEWQPLFRLHCEASDGVYQLDWDDRGQVLHFDRVSSHLIRKDNRSLIQVQVFNGGPIDDHLRTEWIDISAQPHFLINEKIEVFSEAPIPWRVPSDLEKVTRADQSFDLVQVYAHLLKLVGWAEHKWQYRSPRISVKLDTGYPEKTNAAFYWNKQIRLGTGDGKKMRKIALDPSVVSHEWMHSLIEQLTHLPFQAEGGSIQEGMADVMTALYLNSPRIGEYSFLEAGAQRDLSIMVPYSESFQGLYKTSLMLSSLIWKIGQSQSIDLAHDLVLNLLQNLNPASDLKELRQIVIRWSESLNPESSESVILILKEFDWI